MGEDEGGTLKRLGAITAELTDLKIAEDRGRSSGASCRFATPSIPSCTCRAYARWLARGDRCQANALITSDSDAARLTPTIHLRTARSVSILANRASYAASSSAAVLRRASRDKRVVGFGKHYGYRAGSLSSAVSVRSGR